MKNTIIFVIVLLALHTAQSSRFLKNQDEYFKEGGYLTTELYDGEDDGEYGNGRRLWVNSYIRVIEPTRQHKGYCADEVGMVKCDRAHINAWEKFTFTQYHGYWVIRGGNQNKICHGNNFEFKCNHDGVYNDFDRWILEIHGGKQALKNKGSGRYVVAEQQNKKVLWWWEHHYYYLRCDRTAVGPWEKFTMYG